MTVISEQSYPTLHRLFVSDCHKRTELPDLALVKRINRLFVSDCHKRTELPDVALVKRINRLFVSDCHKRTELPDVALVKRQPLQDLMTHYTTQSSLSRAVAMAMTHYTTQSSLSRAVAMAMADTVPCPQNHAELSVSRSVHTVTAATFGSCSTFCELIHGGVAHVIRLF